MASHRCPVGRESGFPTGPGGGHALSGQAFADPRPRAQQGSRPHSRCQRRPCTARRWRRRRTPGPLPGARPGSWPGPPCPRRARRCHPAPSGRTDTSPAAASGTASPGGAQGASATPHAAGVPGDRHAPAPGPGLRSPHPAPRASWLGGGGGGTFLGAPRAMLPRARRDSTRSVSSSWSAPFPSSSTAGFSSFSRCRVGSLMNWKGGGSATAPRRPVSEPRGGPRECVQGAARAPRAPSHPGGFWARTPGPDAGGKSARPPAPGGALASPSGPRGPFPHL